MIISKNKRDSEKRESKGMSERENDSRENLHIILYKKDNIRTRYSQI